MTTMTVSPSSALPSSFGFVAALFKHRSSSRINYDVLNPRVRNVLTDWDASEASAVRSKKIKETSSRKYPETSVDAVEFIRDALGVSQDAVLQSVGIAERTFFGWKSRPDTRPRVGTQGRLWLTVEALYGLESHHLNLAAWFHATPEAQDAFYNGDVGKFQLLELRSAPRPAADLVPEALFFGDFTDPTVSDNVSETHPIPRPTLRARVTPRVALPLRGTFSE